MLLLLSLISGMTPTSTFLCVKSSHHVFFSWAPTTSPAAPRLVFRGWFALVSTKEVVDAEGSESGLACHVCKNLAVVCWGINESEE